MPLIFVVQQERDQSTWQDETREFFLLVCCCRGAIASLNPFRYRMGGMRRRMDEERERGQGNGSILRVPFVSAEARSWRVSPVRDPHLLLFSVGRVVDGVPDS